MPKNSLAIPSKINFADNFCSLSVDRMTLLQSRVLMNGNSKVEQKISLFFRRRICIVQIVQTCIFLLP